MKILSFSLKIMLLALIPAFLMTSCKDEDNPPDTATIHGTITLENAQLWDTWKDSGEVQLTLFPEFVLAVPPAGAGWGTIPDNFFGPGVPGGTFALGAPISVNVIDYAPGTNEIHYELEIDFGTSESATFSALALGLRHNNISDPALRTATLGVHWGEPDTVSHGIVIKIDVGGGQIIPIFNYPAPSTFTVEKGDNLEINFKADFDFVNQWYQ